MPSWAAQTGPRGCWISSTKAAPARGACCAWCSSTGPYLRRSGQPAGHTSRCWQRPIHQHLLSPPIFHVFGHCRFEKADELKRDLKKKQALERAFNADDGAREQAESSSDEEDEDKIAEEKEAGALLVFRTQGPGCRVPGLSLRPCAGAWEQACREQQQR